jgi:hypothetical protein
MQPVLDLIIQRQTAAEAAADALRDQIAGLTVELHQAEAELADLATTHATLTRLTSPSNPAAPHDTTIYQQIVAAFDTAPGALRAKDICRALGIDTEPKDTEGVRAKLKRLVKRQVLTEPEPGLFALTTPTQPSDQTASSGL